MRVLSIDPGPSTGFCLYDSEVKKNFGIVECWQEDLNTVHRISCVGRHDALWYVLSTLDFDQLVGEKFEFRKDDQARDKIDYTAAELVGVIKLYAYQNRHIRLTMQGSSLIGKTAFWSDDNEKVKKLGLYNPKAAPHGMDGLRHLLYYLSFTLNKTEWFERLR